MSSYPSDFDEFLLRPSTPPRDGSAFSFDPSCSTSDPFASTSSGPSYDAGMFSFASGSGDSPTSSGGQSYSPPSSTTSGLPPTEEDLFAMMNGGVGVDGGAFGGEGFSFGSGDAFGAADGLGGVGMQERPPSTEYLDLDPFFQFGGNGLPAHNFLTGPLPLSGSANGSVGYEAVASGSQMDLNAMPIPSFLLSHNFDSTIPAQNPTSSTFVDPQLQSAPPSHPSSHLNSRNPSQPTSSVSSIHSQPPAPAPPPPPPADSTATTAVKRKAPSAIPSDHNAIERKYRDNINDGFTRLRDSVPVLRVLFQTSTPTTQALDTPSPVTGLIDGMPKETKQGKATVLGAAREYIWLLQRERARLARSVQFLEQSMGQEQKEAWRAAFEQSEQSVQLDPYLTSITYPYDSSSTSGESPQSSGGSSSATSPNAEGTKPPPRKRAKAATTASAAAPKAKKAPAGTKAELVSDGGKVVLGVVVSVSLFGGADRLGLASETSGVPVPGPSVLTASTANPGRVMGITRRAFSTVATARTDSSSIWSLTWKVALGLLVLMLVVPAARRLRVRMFRKRIEARQQRLEEIVGREGGAVTVHELRSALGAPKRVTSLFSGIAYEWIKSLVGPRWARSSSSDPDFAAWILLAERQISLPTSLFSYLSTLYTYLRLSNISSAHLPLPKPLALLSLLSIALAGGEITPSATHLWSAARVAAQDFNDRAMAEVLELTLNDVLSIAPECFAAGSSASNTPPLEAIASSLALRDILHLLQTLFASFAPPSTHHTTSPQHLLSSRPPIMSDRARKAVISSEIASLVASTGSDPTSEAHELALVCMGVWSLGVREQEGVRWAVGRLVGLGLGARSLGAGAQALLRVGGVATLATSDEGLEEVVDAPETVSPTTSPIITQINHLATFLVTYQALVLALPARTGSSKSAAKAGAHPGLLPQTLHLRALLDSEEMREVAEEAKERFVDGLYGLGRWSVGWKGQSGDGEDSGFESV